MLEDDLIFASRLRALQEADAGNYTPGEQDCITALIALVGAGNACPENAEIAALARRSPRLVRYAKAKARELGALIVHRNRQRGDRSEPPCTYELRVPERPVERQPWVKRVGGKNCRVGKQKEERKRPGGGVVAQPAPPIPMPMDALAASQARFLAAWAARKARRTISGNCPTSEWTCPTNPASL